MAKSGANEKQLLEMAAVENFIEAYNSEFKENGIEFVSLCAPPEPDAKCKKDGEEFYVEVAHVYGTSIDARTIFARGNVGRRQRIENGMIQLDVKFIVSLNNILSSKVSKTYTAGRVWLLIRNAFPLYGKKDIESVLNKIVIPSGHTFKEIWLLCGRDADAGLLKLWAGEG